MNKTVLILLATLLPALSGCLGAALVGFGGSALVLADRRASETMVTDEAIEMRASKRISEGIFGPRHINITSFNRRVLLTGEVPDVETRITIQAIVSNVQNVKSVYNELDISPPSSVLNRSNDSLITSKVKARFVDANRFEPNHVKVVTEGSVVYLMGLVTATEASAAAEIAATTQNVKKVVRLFEIISDEEAARQKK